jgi:DNA sulfur modification protein DndD
VSAPLEFKAIYIENFGGYYGETSARFPTGERNIMLVHGRNTGGKTSFLNALKWCLYGDVETRSENSLELPQLFNTVAAGEGMDTMRVTLDAKIKGEPYTIIREAKRRFPNTRSTSNNDFTVHFEVKKDGQILSEENSKRVISRIAPKIISRFFLFDGELLKEYEDLVERRGRGSTYPLIQAIEDVLGLPALKTASGFLAKALSLAEQNVSRKAQANTQTKNLSIKLDQMTSQRDEMLEQREKTEAQLEILELEKSALEKEVNKEREMDKLRGKMEQNKESRSRAAKEIDELQAKLQDLSAMAWRDGIHLALEQRQEALESELGDLSRQHDNYVIDEHDLQTLKHIADSGHCDVCDQNVGIPHIQSIQSKIDEMLRSQSDRRAQYEALREKDFQVKQVKSLTRRVLPVYERYEATRERLLGLINDLSELADEHDRMEAESKNEDLEAVRQRRERLEATTREIGFLSSSLKGLEDKVAAHDREINHLIEQISGKQVSKDIEEAKRVKEKLEKLKKIFDEGRGELREEMRRHIENYASRSYKAMIHESDHASVQITPNNYELSIIDTRGQPVVEPSAGATQVLALALIVALGKAGRPIGPIVMDTPFGRLDEDHRGRVLRYLPRQASQLVLLYHSGELQPSTINTVRSRVGCSYTIKKHQEGRSTLVEGDL